MPEEIDLLAATLLEHEEECVRIVGAAFASLTMQHRTLAQEAERVRGDSEALLACYGPPVEGQSCAKSSPSTPLPLRLLGPNPTSLLPGAISPAEPML
jgi:hypothetical protein